MHDEYNPNVIDPIKITFLHKENDNEPPEANEQIQDENEEHVNRYKDNIDDDDHHIGNQ